MKTSQVAPLRRMAAAWLQEMKDRGLNPTTVTEVDAFFTLALALIQASPKGLVKAHSQESILKLKETQ